MKIYALLKQGYEGNETACISEDIIKIHTSIFEDFDPKEEYPELEIWENGMVIGGATGDNVLKKILEELDSLNVKKRFNYKVVKWSESDFDSVLEGAKDLPINPIDPEDENCMYYDKEIINPIDPDADDMNQPYNGWLSILKSGEGYYELVFFLAYHCGDAFFVDDDTVPFGDDEKLKETIKKMVEKYSNQDTIDKLIEDQMKKER